MTASVAPPALVLVLLGATGLSLYLSAWAQIRRRVSGAREFALLMLAIAIYCGAYAFEISRSDLAGILSIIRFEYVGIASLAPCVIAFAWRFSFGKPLPLALRIFLWLFAALTVLIVLTSSSHRLFYIEPYVSTDGPFPTFSAVRGPWYYAHVAVLQLSAVASALILIRNALRSDRRHRRQSLTMAVGGVFPIVAGFAFVAGLVPWGIDPAPLSLAATGIVFAIALFRLGLLEIVPAARELAIDSIRDGFVVADASGRIQDANPAILAMLGKDTGRLSERLDPLSTAGRALGPLLELGEGTIEFTISDSEGRERRLQANAYPVVGRRGGRKGAALLISDITETTALLARLKELADKDSLTGLVNRRRFLEQADREIDLAQREGFPLGFAMADLDHFKNVNDIYGHAAGDFVLVNAARRIESALRSVDIVCRYGGEEFAILIPGAAGDDVFQAAERARAALADSPFDWEGRQISVTGSFGTWHRATDSSESLEECLRKADGAMYAAKAAGRNRVWRAG